MLAKPEDVNFFKFGEKGNIKYRLEETVPGFFFGSSTKKVVFEVLSGEEGISGNNDTDDLELLFLVQNLKS